MLLSYQHSLPRPLCHPHFSAFPPFHCSGAHAVQFSKLVLCQAHAFANLSYLPTLPVIEKSVVFVQQVGDVHFQQFRNPGKLVYWVVVMLRVLIMNIGALVNPCIVSDLPLEQGFFIPVVPQLVRCCRKHCRIGVLDIELFGVGELLWTQKLKAVDCKRAVNRPSVSLLAENIQAVADFEEQPPFWSVPGKGSFFFLLRTQKSRYEGIGLSIQRAAYVAKRIFLLGSNVDTALISPIVPIDIKSS